jgi:hypothetical protein
LHSGRLRFAARYGQLTLLHGNGKAANKPCDLAEISIVPVFNESGELLNTFIVTPQIRSIVAGLWFNLRSRSLT